MLRTDVAGYGEHSPHSGQAARSFGGLSPGAVRLFPPRRAAQAARGLCDLSPGAARLFPLRPQRAPPVGSQDGFRQDPGPVCRVGGGGFSGAEFAPFPSPCLLPPAGMVRLFSGVSQSLCFANRWRCVLARQFFLALPQFKKSSLQLLSGPSGRFLP